MFLKNRYFDGVCNIGILNGKGGVKKLKYGKSFAHKVTKPDIRNIGFRTLIVSAE